MTQAAYRKTLTTARRDLEKLYRQREELERKIARLRQTIVSLGVLTNEGKPREQRSFINTSERQTLTEAVLDVVSASDVPLRPREIRRRLEGLGYDIRSTNPSASVWSVIKRLQERPALRPGKKVLREYEVPSEDGRKWKLGFWWGDQNPPKPWVPTDREQKKAAKAAKRGE